MTADRNFIFIHGARENNLKNLSLRLPKYQITAFTGVSGSGKSSLALDTIAAQSRRELNETFPGFTQQFLPKYGRPDVEKIENLPVAIVVDQKKPAQNARSTVGTYTDIYSLLRLLYSRAGKPFVGYSDTFSFNHPQGKCERCDGLGEIDELDIHKLVNFNKSLNDPGVINYVAFEPGLWRWKRYAFSGLFDLDKKICDYSPEELELFLYSPQIRLKNPPHNWPKSAKFEGLIPRMYRSVIQSEEGKKHRKLLEPMLRSGVCPDCGGARLSKRVLECKLNGKSIADAANTPLPALTLWLQGVDDPIAVDLKRAIGARLDALIEIGLGYLTLGRAMATLSGGETQRCKIAKYINSPLSDVLYVLDEPSVGLHSRDIDLLKASIRKLSGHGNTVLLVEHHREMIEAADHIVEMGPGAGEQGGEILFEGSYRDLLKSDTPTGKMLRQKTPFKQQIRTPKAWIEIKNANLHNLKGFSLSLPLGVLTVIAGVAGAGKSSLMQFFCENSIISPILISQKNIGVSLRSTPATYLEISDEIRKIFARESGQSAALFSFNGRGACPVCGGKGVIVAEMAFMDSIETRCEACGGLRYSAQALGPRVRGLNIAQTMDLPLTLAATRFAGTAVEQKLKSAIDVGLGYLHLNQALSTLSGGELQRLKLASHLQNGPVSGQVFILDEPTDGLHLRDIEGMIALFDRMVDDGNSVFLVEHNLNVLKSADFVVELGPDGGDSGGQLLFSGVPSDLMNARRSVTAAYLRASLEDY